MKDRAAIKKSGGLLLPDLKKAALDTFTPGHPGGDDHIHPSEMARADWCPRSTYYRLLTGKAVNDDTFNFTLESIFDEGHSVEKKWQDRMRQSKKLWGTWKCLICKTMTGNVFEPMEWEGPCVNSGVNHIWDYYEVALGNDTLNIHGHEDGAMCTSTSRGGWWEPSNPAGYLVECKTVGIGTVRHDAPNLVKKHYHHEIKAYDIDGMWRELNRPFTNHVRQTNVYLWLAKEMRLNFDTAVLLYEFKPNQQVKEFPVKLSDSIIEPLLTKAESVVYGIEHKVPPACPTDGCKACKAYEESNASKATDNKRRTVPAASVPGSGSQAPAAGDSGEPVGEAAGRKRTTRRPARPDGGQGPGANEPVSGAEQLGEVSRRPASGCGGRRVIRRKGSDQD
jgi:CRISPR/Cas system-associated exonuclease Cas4 (RecB family)